MFYITNKFIQVQRKEFRIIGNFITAIQVILTLIYPLFAIIVELGNLYINCAILGLTVIYLIFGLIFHSKKKYNMDKIYKSSKIIIKTISLGINIYMVYVAGTNVNGIAIILTTLLILMWIINTCVFIIRWILESKYELAKACVTEDIKEFLSPIITPLNKALDFLKLEKVLPFVEEKPSDKIKKFIEEAKKAESENKKIDVNKEVTKKIDYISKTIDSNNDGKVDLIELIKEIITLDTVKVKKDKFLKDFLKEDEFKKIKFNQKNKRVKNLFNNQEEIFQLTDDLINQNKKDIDSFMNYIDNKNIDIENCNDSTKVFSVFGNILILLQKIIYLYDREICNYNKLTNEEIESLILAFGIINDNDLYKDAKKELYNFDYHYNINKMHIIKKFKNKKAGSFSFATTTASNIFNRYKALNLKSVLNELKQIEENKVE